MLLYLAPLQGLTDIAFRLAFQTCFKDTVDYAVAPYLSLTHGDLLSHRKKLKDVLPDVNKEALPLIPQILGNDPDLFISLAKTLFEMGYPEINWNLGCPYPHICRKKRGAGLLLYPEEIRVFLERVLESIPNALSIKIRLGYANPNELERLIPLFNSLPLASVCIHPRLGIQLYEGETMESYFKDYLPKLSAPVLLNGDIQSLEEIKRIQGTYPQLLGIMLGRGLLSKPYLAAQMKGMPVSKNREAMRHFAHELIYQICSRKKQELSALNKLKEHAFYWSQNFPDQKIWLSAFQHTESIEAFQKRVDQAFVN